MVNNQEYRQEMCKCWEEFLQKHEISTADGVTADAFNMAFDRAFALGKQQKDAESKSMCLSDVKEKIDKWMDSHTEEEVYELLKKYCAVEDADTVIQGWVAVDDDGDLFLYRTKPARDEVSLMWMSGECPLDVGINLFPNLTWESDPIEVEIIIKRKKK